MFDCGPVHARSAEAGASWGWRQARRLSYGIARWAGYWQQQAYAVMLVVRTSDGEIRWMDVSAYLKRESAAGKTVRQIIFAGERFDVMSVRNWRRMVLGE